MAAAMGVAGAAIVLALAVILLFAIDGTAEWSREWVRFGDVTVTAGTSIGPKESVSLRVAVEYSRSWPAMNCWISVARSWGG